MGESRCPRLTRFAIAAIASGVIALIRLARSPRPAEEREWQERFELTQRKHLNSEL